MASKIKSSRPLKKFKVHRNKDGAILVTAKVHGEDFGPGDHILGFTSDEDVLVWYEETMADHRRMASLYNAIDAHKDGQMTDEDFQKHCVSFVRQNFQQSLLSWAIWEKAGDLPKVDKDTRQRHTHARKLFKRLLLK